MQFQLRTLLTLITVAAVICATFVAPPVIAVPVLCLILWTSPVLWLSGVYACRGRRQAFFLGGTVAGTPPYLAAVILSIAYYAEWIDDGGLPDIMEQQDSAFRVALAVYLPGVCSLIAGVLSWFAYEYQRRIAAGDTAARLAREEAGSNRETIGEPLTR